MRVTLLSHNAREADAIGNQLAGKIRFLSRHGWEVRLYVESADRLHPAVAPFAVPQTASGLWKDAEQRNFLLESDLVMAEYGQAYGLLELLAAVAREKPRIIVDYYGVTPPELGGPGLRRRLEASQRQRGLLWCAEAILVHSRASAKELIEAAGVPAERIHQLPCYADLEPIFTSAVELDLRNGLGLDDATVLLFVGRLAANKRVPVLIDAVGRLRDRSPPVHAVIIGDVSDLYERELDICRKRAAEHGVADRVHFLGQVNAETLRDWYRSADVFVMPSAHEGYCLPVVEALAAGLPVVAARAGALPETVGDAGLTFHLDDPEDLARNVRKVLGDHVRNTAFRRLDPARAGSTKMAIVAPRYGDDFAGGAERSLRTIAVALQRAGLKVEVFTTCNRHDSQWANHLPPGESRIDGVNVHRFPIDPHNRECHLTSLQMIREQEGRVERETENEYLRHSLHSTALVDELERRQHDFDAVIAGPYLFGLTFETARRLGRKVLVLPCFHDESLAYLERPREAYRETGGLLYHSEEEKLFAEAALGVNHPNTKIIHTLLEAAPGDPQRGRARCGESYIIYCGRYSPEKGVDLLLAFAGDYAVAHPGRFRFVFMGQAGGSLPQAPWVLDLGFVEEQAKRDVLAGARALVQLSRNESLSLVVLESWLAGVPVIGHIECPVVRGQIERAGGGQVVANSTGFAAALDSLWQEPDRWRDRGESGRRYVEERYLDETAFVERLREAIDNLSTPIAEQMRRSGLKRARQLDRPAWEARFAAVIAEVIDRPRERGTCRLEILPQAERKEVSPEAGVVLTPLRITNRGTLPLTPGGPAAVEITSCVVDAGEPPRSNPTNGTRLPALLTPGQSTVAVVPVAVPPAPGSYRVRFDARPFVEVASEKLLELEVVARGPVAASGVEQPFLDQLEKALAEAHELRTLPDDYADLTQGVLASWKRRVKQKLLHQFRRSYVDVLSRQQSAFNEQVLVALAQLRDCCLALGQTASLRPSQPDLAGLLELVEHLQAGQKQIRKRQAKLERRLRSLEKALNMANQR